MFAHYKELLISMREFRSFIERHKTAPILPSLTFKYIKNRKEFETCNAMIAYPEFITQNSPYLLVKLPNGNQIIYCPLLDALVEIGGFKPQELKPCLSAMLDTLSIQRLNELVDGQTFSGFLATINNTVENSTLIKIFLEDFFKTYYPNSLRR